jgi:glycerol-3-phosphate acyltransferase PlsY
MIPWIIALVGSYLVGSINFSILLCHIIGKNDPRTANSGNPGVTNVYRQAGIVAAFFVLALDVGRALLLAYLGTRWFPLELVDWLGCALILGNRYPCFHGFHGGKGVATMLGFTLGLAPAWAGIAALTWLAVRALVTTSFIPSFAMLAVLAGGCIVGGGSSLHAFIATLLMCVLIVIGHKKNIEEFMEQRKRRV